MNSDGRTDCCLSDVVNLHNIPLFSLKKLCDQKVHFKTQRRGERRGKRGLLGMNRDNKCFFVYWINQMVSAVGLIACPKKHV